MLLDLTRLQNRSVNELSFSDTITIDESLYKNTDIRSLSPIKIDVNIRRVMDSSYKMLLNIEGTMILPCALTLKDVSYPFSVETEVKLSVDDENDEEYVKINQNNIDIIPIVWQNIVLEIPLRVVSDNLNEISTSGDGWKLVQED
jgi:uncharacterized protein